MPFRLAISSAVFAFALPALAQEAEDDRQGVMSVTFEQSRSDHGKLCLSVWASADGFPRDPSKAVYSQCHAFAELGDGVTLALPPLPFGRYAMAMFHDENDDGVCNTNVLGIPREGFGFTRNPRVRTRAPTFDETAVELSGPEMTTPIRVTYLLAP